MSDNEGRLNYIVTVTYDYEQGERHTIRLLILNSLTSRNAVKESLEHVPYDQHIVSVTSFEYKLPTIGSVTFVLEPE